MSVNLDLNIDDDWTVTYEPGDGDELVVTFTDTFATGVTEFTLRFTGKAVGRLRFAIEGAYALSEPSSVDEKLARIQEAADRVQAALDAVSEANASRFVFPDEVKAGDWVKFPPSRIWRKVHAVFGGGAASHRRVFYDYAGRTHPVDVEADIALPYMTAEEMDALGDDVRSEPRPGAIAGWS